MSRSITPAPSGSLSPDFITVPSTTGFSAGDYVYQKNGDFGLPVVGSGTVNFNATQNAPVSMQSSSNGAVTVVNSFINSNVDSGASSGQNAAKLTNGNIVVVARAVLNGYASFKIVDTNNNIVVASTNVTTATTVNNTNCVGVVALSGGGFVVFFSPSAASKVGFAVYTNTGAVTTAYAEDSTFTGTIVSGSGVVTGVAQPNGGFVLAAINSANSALFRVFSSTGAGISGWTVPAQAVAPSGSQRVNMAVRSDSTFCLFYMSSVVNTYKYFVYAAIGGTQLATGNIVASSTPVSSDVCCLTNNTFILGYISLTSPLTFSFAPLPTGDVLGTVVNVPTTNATLNVSGTTALSNIYLKALSSGGFVYLFNDTVGATWYVFYNSAGVVLYGSAVPKLFPYFQNYQNANANIGLVEITGYLSLYYYGPWNISAQNAINSQTFNSKIDLTTYNIYSSATSLQVVGAASASGSGYARSSSLPMKAAALATATQTLSANTAIAAGSTYVLPPTQVTGAGNNALASTTLPDGRFAIVYKFATSPFNVTLNVYSIAGVLQSSTIVGTARSGDQSQISVAALTGGSVVVAYPTAATTFVITQCSSGGTILATQTITRGSNGWFNVTGISGDRVAVAYDLSNTSVRFNIYSNTLVLLQNAVDTGLTSGASQSTVIKAGSTGFWVGTYSVGNFRWVFCRENATNVFAITNSASNIAGTDVTGSNWLTVSPSNVVTVLYPSSTTAGRLGTVSNESVGTILQTGSSFNISLSYASNMACVGVTGAGTFAYLSSGPTGTSNNFFGFTGAALVNGDTATPGGRLTATVNVTGAPTYGMQPCITPSYGYNAVIAWFDINGALYYAIANAFPYTEYISLTAGVTGSAPTTPLNISQGSGYFLAGVAVSDCPAGGTGQIQTNGVANLNSQYSTSTAFQGFDFQNPVTIGVRGTAVGRTVTMIKD